MSLLWLDLIVFGFLVGCDHQWLTKDIVFCLLLCFSFFPGSTQPFLFSNHLSHNKDIGSSPCDLHQSWTIAHHSRTDEESPRVRKVRKWNTGNICFPVPEISWFAPPLFTTQLNRSFNIRRIPGIVPGITSQTFFSRPHCYKCIKWYRGKFAFIFWYKPHRSGVWEEQYRYRDIETLTPKACQALFSEI